MKNPYHKYSSQSWRGYQYIFPWLVICSLLLLCSQNLALDLSDHDDSPQESIFFDFKNDNELLELIYLAESQLKIYIYPVPESGRLSSSEEDMLGHFRIENLYRKYLTALGSHVSVDDPRHNMVVDDISQANAFIIDNDFMRLTRVTKCEPILTKHMKSITDNVIHHHLYYNKTNGADHFFMAVYDKGYCGVTCEAESYESDKSMKTSSFYPILKANAIGNYGMDDKSFTGPPEKEYPCHRANHDIVVPQLFQESSSQDFFLKYHKSRIPSREYDSSFSGCSWGERKPLETMVIAPEKDFADGAENFVALTTDPKYKLNGNPEFSLLYRSYFMYDPCGYACWSRRKYEAMMHYSVPIIVSSGAVQAFEKFIDWKKFTVKMSKETWYDDNKRLEYRKKLRKHADAYRSALNACWTSLHMIPPANMNHSSHPPVYDDSWVDIGRKDRSSPCGKVFDTLIWKKTSAIQKAVKWFDFTTYKTNRKNAFRLLTLEIWCRIKSIEKSAKHQSICQRASDHTARLEYIE